MPRRGGSSRGRALGRRTRHGIGNYGALVNQAALLSGRGVGEVCTQGTVRSFRGEMARRAYARERPGGLAVWALVFRRSCRRVFFDDTVSTRGSVAGNPGAATKRQDDILPARRSWSEGR
jgi:hypothetical protein